MLLNTHIWSQMKAASELELIRAQSALDRGRIERQRERTRRECEFRQ